MRQEGENKTERGENGDRKEQCYNRHTEMPPSLARLLALRVCWRTDVCDGKAEVRGRQGSELGYISINISFFCANLSRFA